LLNLRGLIGSDEANLAYKLTDSSGPSIKHTQRRQTDGKLRQDNSIQDTNEEEISVGFATDLFAEQGALQVREYS
jgi:hypothetical protein